MFLQFFTFFSKFIQHYKPLFTPLKFTHFVVLCLKNCVDINIKEELFITLKIFLTTKYPALINNSVAIEGIFYLIFRY